LIETVLMSVSTIQRLRLYKRKPVVVVVWKPWTCLVVSHSFVHRHLLLSRKNESWKSRIVSHDCLERFL